jgi:methyl-accepting chemotaxis protein WspA
VNQGVEAVKLVSAQLGQIIEEVQRLTPRFEAVNEGMQAQATGASQISAAMVGLTEVARVTSASVAESNQAAGGLHDAVRGLREEVARFTVAEPGTTPAGGPTSS